MFILSLKSEALNFWIISSDLLRRDSIPRKFMKTKSFQVVILAGLMYILPKKNSWKIFRLMELANSLKDSNLFSI